MKLLAGTLVLVLGFASPCLFAADAAKAEAEAMCARWAKEDGVEPGELEQYMTECVAEQMSFAEGGASTEERKPVE